MRVLSTRAIGVLPFAAIALGLFLGITTHALDANAADRCSSEDGWASGCTTAFFCVNDRGLSINGKKYLRYLNAAQKINYWERHSERIKSNGLRLTHHGFLKNLRVSNFELIDPDKMDDFYLEDFAMFQTSTVDSLSEKLVSKIKCAKSVFYFFENQKIAPAEVSIMINLSFKIKNLEEIKIRSVDITETVGFCDLELIESDRDYTILLGEFSMKKSNIGAFCKSSEMDLEEVQ